MGDPAYMNDSEKPRAELISELQALRQQLSDPKRHKIGEDPHPSHVCLRGLIEAIPDLVFLINEDGQVLDALVSNETKSLMYRSDEIDPVNKRIQDIFQIKDSDLIMETVHNTIKTNTIQKLEYYLVVPEGGRWFEGRAAIVNPIIDKQAVVWAARDITEIKKAQAQLEHSQKLALDANKAMQASERQAKELLERNRRLIKQLITIQEQERQQLARELHDEFGQWLTAVSMHAQNITELNADPNSKIFTSAKTIAEGAGQMRQVTRNIIHKLRPQALDDLGLGDGLRDLVSQWQRQHPDTRCDLNIRCDLELLEETLKITLYRIIQESLTNAAKHSQAHHVAIQLDCQSAIEDKSVQVTLEIEDDGVGMELSAPSDGVGLLGIQERVVAMGGEFNLMSEPDKGVCIEVRITGRMRAE